jgi:hypothetical protein
MGVCVRELFLLVAVPTIACQGSRVSTVAPLRLHTTCDVGRVVRFRVWLSSDGGSSAGTLTNPSELLSLDGWIYLTLDLLPLEGALSTFPVQHQSA